MSSTAPSAAVPVPGPPLPPATTTAVHPPVLPFSSSLPTTHHDWLSMQIFHDLGGVSAGGGSSVAAGSGGGGAGPPAPRFPDYMLPVADMAETMFNSGSTSSNSMDLIFSSMDDKWDSEEKKE
ncbi:UNVERIFIED_CONTAM: hypothetical protein Sradi_6485900 [Sesamum radiatum]|uniref:Uncharacterized protein n=1 Tax=Sesamum radiatum TaxID=300843 RepID=A0AAW2JUM7_SESRA